MMKILNTPWLTGSQFENDHFCTDVLSASVKTLAAFVLTIISSKGAVLATLQGLGRRYIRVQLFQL